MQHSNTALELLHEARRRYTQAQIAHHIGRDTKTVRRWEKGISTCPSMVASAMRELLNVPQTGSSMKETKSFEFIDLFAGIGGIRKGFEDQGGKCIFTCEWNSFAKKTYLANFTDDHPFESDIVPLSTDNDIPDHDVLLAGFPCQPFSIAGVSKKNSLGLPHGFECATQGTLFFEVARIIKHKRPKAFLLENVKNLISHNQGNTFKVIMRTLRDELGYYVPTPKIIDGCHFTPQHRERIIIVGFRDKNNFSLDDLNLPTKDQKLFSILHKTDGSEPFLEWDGDRYFDHAKNHIQPKYTLSAHLWKYLQEYAAKHRAAGNGFGYGLVTENDIARTLSARYYKDGSEILVNQGKRKHPRKLTPRECARLMGFPDTFKIPVSDTQAYRQFGNSVVIPVINSVAKLMVPYINPVQQLIQGTLNFGE